MIALPVILPNRRLNFTDTGEVLEQSSGRSVGRWSAESSNAAEQNCLFFFDENGARLVLKAHFSFTAQNQLHVALVPKDGVVSEESAVTFNGSIEIDDEHDVIYALAKGPASDTGQVVIVYGHLAFDGPKNLVLRMAGGGQTAISSHEALPLSADQNIDAARAGRDLLVFHAITTNTYDGATEHRPAAIGFAGQWKLWPEGLSFECSADGDLAKPNLVLSLKGRCKAVAAGLEFRLKDGDAQALFAVEGRHTYDAGSATWSIAIGYSQLAEPKQRIKAAVKGQITHKTTGGNQLQLEGSLSYQGAGGSAGTIDLAIAAEYTFAGGKIVFKANANWDGSRYQYDLQLGGEIKMRDGKLVFEVKYSSANTASIEVKYTGSDADFLKYFNVAITRDSQGKVKAAIGFSIQVSYINGVQVAKAA